jgi:hypothetical protein
MYFVRRIGPARIMVVLGECPVALVASGHSGRVHASPTSSEIRSHPYQDSALSRCSIQPGTAAADHGGQHASRPVLRETQPAKRLSDAMGKSNGRPHARSCGPVTSVPPGGVEQMFHPVEICGFSTGAHISKHWSQQASTFVGWRCTGNRICTG